MEKISFTWLEKFKIKKKFSYSLIFECFKISTKVVSSPCLQLWARQLWLENVLWRKNKWDFPGNPGKRTRRMAHKQSNENQFSSVTQSCLTCCNPLGCSMARPPCPSRTPGAYSDSRPLSQWSHPTISSSVVSFYSCPQSFPASGPF